MENQLNVLSSRAGFNTALRHFKSVSSYISDVQEGGNLADLINESIGEKEIDRFQVKSILNALLVDKFGYRYRSHNLENSIENAAGVLNAVSKWGNIQLVVSYFHPQAGLSVINPKNKASWDSILPLTKDELIVIYSGGFEDALDAKTLESSIDDFLLLLYGNKVKPKEKYMGRRVEEEEVEQRIAPVQAPKRRMTPRYSVQVTNELFHNGNVEAWKKIVESYRTTYSDLDVLIWYENERINDINALFKWGKVKHGGLIFFSVVGENITDVSKLQRYLFEGASPRFEVFLRGGIGRVLDLF
jgi:hypothetical protein